MMEVSNYRMFREIEKQIKYYKRHNIRTPEIVIHPDFYYSVAMIIRPEEKAELFGAEVNLSEDIKPNEFIIGVKFEVQHDRED